LKNSLRAYLSKNLPKKLLPCGSTAGHKIKRGNFMKRKLMSRFALLGVLGLSTVVAVARPVFAADGDGAAKKERPAGGRGGALAKALESLDLSAEQKEKLKPILKDQAEKSKAIREDAALDRKAKAEKMKALMD